MPRWNSFPTGRGTLLPVQMDPALFRENERTAPSTDSRSFADVGTLTCEAGGSIPKVTVAYETWGTLNQERDNAVLVCHALSGDSHAVGWWGRLVGPGKAIDTNRYFVIGTNSLGGCQGTTGPASAHPDDDKPYGSRFPIITLQDMVEVQGRLMDQLGIQRLHAVVGGSMGGMQALQWTIQFPGRVGKAIITASSGSHSSMQIGFNEAARQSVMRDPRWRGGDYPLSDPPKDGLSVARMMGHMSYLSEAAFESKFGRRLQGKTKPDYHLGVEFEIESYLSYQGDKFTTRFDANSFLVMTRAVDYFNVTNLEASNSDYLLVSFTSDWLYPSHQTERLHQLALAAGLRSEHLVIDLPYGHDAFLLDAEHQGAAFASFLNHR